jgi:hypothetical protein
MLLTGCRGRLPNDGIHFRKICECSVGSGACVLIYVLDIYYVVEQVGIYLICMTSSSEEIYLH